MLRVYNLDSFQNIALVQLILPHMILKVNHNKKTHLITTQDKPKFDDIQKSIAQTFQALPAKYSLSYNDEDGDQITLQTQQDYQVLLSSILKTIRIKIKEVKYHFAELTEKIDIQEKIDEIKESFKNAKPQTQKIAQVQKSINSNIAELDESIIEEKLNVMIPEIVSKIKSQISQQLSQRSRISNKPLITEEIPQIKQIQTSFTKNKSFQSKPLVIHQGVRCNNCQKNNISGVRYKCSVCVNYDFCQECQELVQHQHSFLKIKHPNQVPIKILTVINDEQDKLELNGQKIDVRQRFQNLVNNGLNLNFINSCLDQNNKQNPRNVQEIQKSIINKQAIVQNQIKSEKIQEQKKEVIKMEQDVRFKKGQKVEIKQKIISVQKQPNKKPISQADEKKVIESAQYIASFGFQFRKSYQWAKNHYNLSKEQLLQLCLNSTEFLK